MNVRRTLVVFTVCAIATAACANVLGIRDIHDDPADAGGNAGGPDTGVDTSEAQATGDDAPGEAGPGDAPGDDAAPDGPAPIDPGLGCPAGDAGYTTFIPTVEHFQTFLAVDGVYLYAGAGSVLRCGLEGCGSGATTIIGATPYGLAANGRHVLWSDRNHFLVSTPDGMDAGIRLLAGSGLVASVGDDVYVLSPRSLLHVVDAPGFIDASAGSQALAYNSYQALAASSQAVVVAGDSADGGTEDILLCAPGACAGGPTLVAQPSYPGPSYPAVLVAVDDASAYWTDPVQGAIFSCPLAGCAGHAQAIVTSVQASALFVDATGLYWANATDYGIYKAHLDGTSPVLVARLPVKVAYSLVANDKCVYWSTQEDRVTQFLGSVYAAPQP